MNINEENLENISFTDNKYYKEIIKEFISNYNLPRVIIHDDLIEVKANDRAGSRNINFKIDEFGRLCIKVDRIMDMIRFQDILVYNDDGIMVERINSQAELKKDIFQKFKDKSEILAEEFDKLGQNTSIYTNKIFNSIRLRKVKRPDNYGLEGIYNQKVISYDSKGLMTGKIIEGTFNVLNSNSISTLEFPNDNDIIITKEEILDDNDNNFIYPNSRSL